MNTNILIVDDSDIIRAVIKKSLSISGLSIGRLFEAANGRQALSTLADEKIDIVLTDINMPEMNGMELVEALVANHTLASTPVIIISTERSKARIDRLEHYGIKGYINKPFRPEDLRDTITRVLAEQGA